MRGWGEQGLGIQLAVRALKKPGIYFALVLACLFVSMLAPFSSFMAILLWDSAAAVAFVLATNRLVGRSPLFIPSVVLLVTVVFPFVILCLIAVRMHHSWQESAKAVAISMHTLNPFHSLYMLVPAGVAVGFGYFYRGAKTSLPESWQKVGTRFGDHFS